MSVAKIGRSAIAPPKKTANRSSAIDPSERRRPGDVADAAEQAVDDRLARRSGSGIGLREIASRQTVEIASRTAIAGVRRRRCRRSRRDPADRRARGSPPVWLTLLMNETPRAASSSGMTWASKAVSAGRSKPLATPIGEDDREDRRAAPSAPLAEATPGSTAQSVDDERS